MQITKAEVIPMELDVPQPMRTACGPEVDRVTAVFVRIETRRETSAWGCTVVAPGSPEERAEEVVRACRNCADLAPDLHPTNIEYSLSRLAPLTADAPSALCAFDLAFHDLLGLAAGMPLYRLMGGYRNRIQTSVTLDIAPVKETVEMALDRASQGFRMLKIKGGLDPEDDVHRARAVCRALPDLTIRLDADGGYTVQQALNVARALEGKLEMLEQPTPAGDLDRLCRTTRHSPVPILADQSVVGPASALELAACRAADGLSVKLAACGGLRFARQLDAIARAARIATMVGCMIEPALLTAAGMSFALSSPNVHYGDLDGHLHITDDPTLPGFRLEDGWLIASDTPGLGCSVEL